MRTEEQEELIRNYESKYPQPSTKASQNAAIKYKLANGQEVNISGAKVGKYKKASASQADKFYLQTNDGQTITISRWDYHEIEKKLKN